MAIELAKHYSTEVISADSRQFYVELNIGTAKPSAEELASAKHHFINSHHIHEHYSAGDFEREALAKLDELFQKKDIVILVGGSGLFVKALCEGLDNLPQPSAGVRETLNEQLKKEGLEGMQERLKQVDPEYYHQIDISNPQRVIRALEVYESTGKPFSYFRKNQVNKRPFQILPIGLYTDREVLYQRINSRVDSMIDDGLLQEVQSLYYYKNRPALLTVGYVELFDYLEGKLTLDESVDRIKQNSRRYAKRQITWFKKMKDISWFEPGRIQEIISHIDNLK